MAGERVCLVITSIGGPDGPLAALASGAAANGFDFVVIGDEASPARFELPGCDFFGLDRQADLPFELARLCPTRSYARKNLGYLLAMARGADVIVESDDDTIAYDSFWAPRRRAQSVKSIGAAGWVNIYRYFSDSFIWPRGLPLDSVRAAAPALDALPLEELDCPIQQGLVDDDPDVDAIYRLLFDLPFRFESRPSVALTRGTWSPFNSQNTTWWPDAFPLLYLPAHCTMRMTDIWRSFIALRLAGANGWGVLFHAPTIGQSRNAHDLMRDFRDEVPGYLDSRAICAALDELDLAPGVDQLPGNLRLAYGLLVDRGWLDARELPLLDAWLADVLAVRHDAEDGHDLGRRRTTQRA